MITPVDNMLRHMLHVRHILLLLSAAICGYAAPVTMHELGSNTVHRTVLKNGLKVLAIQGTNTTANVFLAIGAGNRNEAHTTAGLAHLTEHMLFTGTKTMPGDAFETTVKKWGGRANAYTRDDYTMYYDVGIPNAQLDRVLDMEADRLRNLTFDRKWYDYEQERLRVEETNTWSLGQEIDTIVDAFAYPDHGYGSGLIEGRHTRAPWLPTVDVRQFYNAWYHPRNAALVIVADLPPAEAIGKVEKAFGGLKPGPRPERRAVPRLPARSEHVLERPVSEAQHILAFRAPPITIKNVATMDLLALILQRRAGNLEPPLRAGTRARVEGGLFTFRSGLALDDLPPKLTEMVSSNELATCKRLLRNTYLETPLYSRPYFSIGAELASLEVADLGEIPFRYAAAIDATTAADLDALAIQILDPKRRIAIRLLPDGTQPLAELPEKPADLADYADRAQAEGRLDDAIRAYTKLFGMTKSHMYKVIYLTTRGQLHVENKNFAAGIADFKQALALSDYPAIKPLLADAEDRLAKQMERGDADGAAKSERDKAVEAELADQRAELERLIPEISKEIEDWRGLKFKQPVAVTFTNVTESEDLAGYYNSETKQLVVKVHRGRPRFSRGVLLHELVHALQDQHFDLATQHKIAAKHGTDAERALSCLIEGVAILAVADLMKYDFAAHSNLGKAKGEIDDARFSKLFTYGQGFSFVKHLMDEGVDGKKEWDAVAAAWEAPPRRTIEVLDPDRYGEKPTDDGSAGAWDLVRVLANKAETRNKALGLARLIESARRDADGVTFEFEGEDEAAAVARNIPRAKAAGKLVLVP